MQTKRVFLCSSLQCELTCFCGCMISLISIIICRMGERKTTKGLCRFNSLISDLSLRRRRFYRPINSIGINQVNCDFNFLGVFPFYLISDYQCYDWFTQIRLSNHFHTKFPSKRLTDTIISLGLLSLSFSSVRGERK